MFVQVHRSAAGVLWRFRTETGSLLHRQRWDAGNWPRRSPPTWTVVILTVTARAVTVLPWPGGSSSARAWCVLSRHRIQRVCFETRMHTRSGRLPLVLRIYPTQVGERALIWCRAGICAEDFEPTRGRDRRRLLRPPGPGRGPPAVGADRASWTSCAATPSRRTMSSLLASPGCLRNGGRRHDRR